MKKEKSIIKAIAISGLLLAFLLISSTALHAQDEETIRTMQAASIGQDLELKKKAQNKLTKAYLEFRENISAQGKEKLKDLEGEERNKAADEIHRNNLSVFNKKLAKILDPDQAARTSFLLGSLNNRWDNYLEILLGFSLEEDMLNQTSQAVYEYVSKYLEERKKASDADTRFSGRIATQLKEELDGKMTPILNDDQIIKWKESTAFKRKTKQTN